jgi:flagellar hook-associated protein 2
MGQITSGVGLISGINSKDIIDQLMQLEQRPKLLLQSRKDKLSAQRDAYKDISAQVSALTTSARTFQRPSTFTIASATSSDQNVLTASTSPGAAVGSYQLQVARLVTSQQSVTSGFVSADATVKAGNLTIEMGGGNLNTQTTLSQLNGGAGVRRGQFRISDRSGKSSVIDVSAAITLDDVVKKINTSLDISVRASIKDDKLVLTDSSGSITNNLIVQDLADGHAAEDLGLVKNIAANTFDGADINSLGLGTALSALNDGLGVRTGPTGPDLVMTARDGSTINVTLGTAKTVGDVITAINTAAVGKITASLEPGSNGIRLTSIGGGATALAVADGTGSKAATDLGLAKTGSTAQLDGNVVLAGLNTVMLKSLKGGAGITLGFISIEDRLGQQKDVDLSGATTIADVIDTINNTSGLAVTASLNSAGNGLQIADRSGGTGNLIIGEVGGGTTSATLGLTGTFAPTTPVARGANLQLRWVNENMSLTSYNGGKGVTPGSFKITNSKGTQITVNLTDGTSKTLADIINKINAANGGVTASINANGDGLLMTDTAAGGGKLKIENVVGTTAKDLNILGEAATAGAGTIDGSFEKTFAFTTADTLTTVSTKIKDAGFGVTANIINDGSSGSPFRLSLTAYNTGRAGRVNIDGGATGLDSTTLVEAQDAAAFIGGTGSSQPLLITSNTNSLTNLVAGVTIDLHGVSSGPVTLNIARDPEKVVEQVQKFIDTFNDVTGKIDELTKFDPETKKGGILLGESAIQSVQQEMYIAVQSVTKGAGQYSLLSDVGITIGDGAKLQFDAEKFKVAMAKDPEALKNLFAQTASGLTTATALNTLNNGAGVRSLGAGQPDFRLALKDGTHFDVTLPPADSINTISSVISAINNATTGKATVSVNSAGNGLQVTDNTAGGGTFAITTLGGSAAALDLGISGTWATGIAAGKPIFTNRKLQTGGGLGYQIERALNLLVDPVDGVITRENKSIDDRSAQYDKRMADLDDLVASKRARLERQFANMESVLAGLQGQQSALAGLNSIQPAAA